MTDKKDGQTATELDDAALDAAEGGRSLGPRREPKSILFFDEADAVMGKRTEVKDSHDRYANLETSHLQPGTKKP
ncbi:MAG: hypothetical protein AAF409_20555 [Pseudomonadota bacterium]